MTVLIELTNIRDLIIIFNTNIKLKYNVYQHKN